jgi:hypothetical protein
VPETLILKKIETSRCHFDTFPTVLAELKYKGVSDAILSAMIDAGDRRPGKSPERPRVENVPRQVETSQSQNIVAQEVLTNVDIIKMLRNGLSSAIVEAAVKRSPGKFDTSANALVTLKSAGATETTDPLRLLFLQVVSRTN